jgi:AcrR family transcriptional regulator
LTAVFDVVADRGYDGLTVEAVAEHSGVHKTTIYRRWGSIDAVLFDAVVVRAEQAIPLERSGDIKRDLVAMAEAVATNLEDPVAQAVVAATLARPGVDGIAELSERFWTMRIGEAARMVEDAQKTGRVDRSLDAAVVIEKIVGPIWFSTIVLRRSVDAAFIDSLVVSALAAA